MRLFTIAFAFLFFTQTPARADESRPCIQALTQEQNEIPKEFSKQASNILYTDLVQQGVTKSKAKGYAKLVSAMILSAAATTYLTTKLPNGFQFLSFFISQLAAIGVYEFGAPIWEPVRSRFRQMSFGIRQAQNASAASMAKVWEQQWWRTQENLSLNAQMSRNLTNQFIISVQQNFFEARRAINSQNEVYAIEQIASAAYRMRTWHSDVAADDPAVAEVVRAAFTHHIVVNEDFVARVRARIREKDAMYFEKDVERYYEMVLRAWLGLLK